MNMRSELMILILLLGLATPGRSAPAAAAAAPAISMELTQTEHGDALISLAELATEARVPKEARKLYDRALKADGKGDQVRALEQAQAAVDLAPAYFQAHAALAVAHLKASELDRADRELDIAVSLNPQYLPAREIRGLVHYFRGDFRETVLALEPLVQQAPCRGTARYFLAQALLRLGEVRRARYHLEMAKILGRDKGRLGHEGPELGMGWEGASFQEESRKTRRLSFGDHRPIP
jgi:tetratricopeptide (TPR) repeat protein